MLDSLLGLVDVLVTNDPAQVANNLQEIHQKILAPDQQRDQSIANVPLLKPALLDYLTEANKICQCKYSTPCVNEHVTATQIAAKKFKTIFANITPTYLTGTQQTDYKTIATMLPIVSQMPIYCLDTQDPKISIKDYYPQSRLDFFLKELHTVTQNVCSCGNSSICLNKANGTLTTIYNNLDTSKITNNYAKAMWITYDTLSRICINLPNNTNKDIIIPNHLLINETLLERPILTLEQAKAYIGHSITVTRINHLIQSGILIKITDKLLILEAPVEGGKVNYYIPIKNIVIIQGNQPKENL